jgi:hypothetical protein
MHHFGSRTKQIYRLTVLPPSPILFIFLIEIIKRKLACKLLVNECLAVVLDGFQTVVSPPRAVCPILQGWGIFLPHFPFRRYGPNDFALRPASCALADAGFADREQCRPALHRMNHLCALRPGLRPDTSANAAHNVPGFGSFYRDEEKGYTDYPPFIETDG